MDHAFRPASDPKKDRIPVERLGAGSEPILFFDEMVLFEDELGDNGTSVLSLKVVSEAHSDSQSVRIDLFTPFCSVSCHPAC